MAFKILRFWTAGDMVEYETNGGTVLRGEIAYMEQHPTDSSPLIMPEYRAWKSAQNAGGIAAGESRRKADLAAEAKAAEDTHAAEAKRQAEAVKARDAEGARTGKPVADTEAHRLSPADADAQRQAEARRIGTGGVDERNPNQPQRPADARAAASPAGMARTARDAPDEPPRR